MTDFSHREAKIQIAIGMLALALASIALTIYQSNFLAGFGTGIGVSLLIFGARGISRR